MEWIDDTPERKSLASANSVDIRHSDLIEYPLENYREYRPVASINHVMYLGQKGFMATLHTLGYQRSGSVFSTFNASKSELDKIVDEWKQKINLIRKQYSDRTQGE
jgi:hypothetical protein